MYNNMSKISNASSRLGRFPIDPALGRTAHSVVLGSAYAPWTAVQRATWEALVKDRAA